MATPHRITQQLMAPAKQVPPKLKKFRLTIQIPTESQTQCAFVSWLRIYEHHHPELKLGFAVPNGGARNIATATRLKKEGVKAGVPDFLFPLPRGGFAGLAIEFKREATGRISPAQDAYIAALRLHGCWQVLICTDWHSASRAVLDYLALPVLQQFQQLDYPAK
jgi:hypothetical protein